MMMSTLNATVPSELSEKDATPPAAQVTGASELGGQLTDARAALAKADEALVKAQAETTKTPSRDARRTGWS